MNTTATIPTFADQLHAAVTTAEPDVVGALAVFPLITERSPRERYLSFAEAHGKGAAVKELETGASVNDLLVINPLDVAVLLYEGEEVLGAQQNRTFDQSVLVPPRSRLRVPVCCVEEGRWDHLRHGEHFAPAPQAAYPELRRRKNVALRSALAAGAEGRANQDEVWSEVAAKAERLDTASPTGAMHDVFDGRRGDLDAASRAIEMKCSQVGSLVAIGGQFVVLDYISDVEAFASLHDRLVAGYALDAVDVAPGNVPSVDDARDYLRLLLDVRPQRRPAIGHGDTQHFAFGGLAGTSLAAGDELGTLTAFSQAGAAA